MIAEVTLVIVVVVFSCVYVADLVVDTVCEDCMMLRVDSVRFMLLVVVVAIVEYDIFLDRQPSIWRGLAGCGVLIMSFPSAYDNLTLRLYVPIFVATHSQLAVQSLHSPSVQVLALTTLHLYPIRQFA